MRNLLLLCLLCTAGCGGQTGAELAPRTKPAAVDVNRNARPSESPWEGDLLDAVKEGLVATLARGDGLSRATIEIESKVRRTVTVHVAAATYLGSRSAHVQNMIVTKSAGITILPGDPRTPLSVPVACVNMALAAPTHADELVIQPLPSHGVRAAKWSDLKKLLSSPEFARLDGIDQQFAIWTISDNPPSGEAYVPITATVAKPGLLPLPSLRPSGPNLTEIGELFEKVGIDRQSYAALGSPSRGSSVEIARRRIDVALVAQAEAAAWMHKSAEAEQRKPPPQVIAEVTALKAAAEDVQAAERLLIEAILERNDADAEAKARTNAAAKYRRWLTLAVKWSRTALPKEEADHLHKQWSALEKDLGQRIDEER